MSGFSVSAIFKGVQDIPRKFKEFEQRLMEYQVAAMQKAALRIHEVAVTSIQDNSSGTPQKRWTNGVSRVVNVSAPGDPPNTDTGRLVQSIQVEFDDSGLTASVGTNLKYGAYLEFGTTKMKARPWLAPAVVQTTSELKNIFEQAFKNAVLGAGK